MKKITSVSVAIIVLFSASSAYSAECDSDYVKNRERTTQLILSENQSSVALGRAQKDCWGVALQENKPLCVTFRDYEKKFLSLPKEDQISKGNKCFNKLIAIGLEKLQKTN